MAAAPLELGRMSSRPDPARRRLLAALQALEDGLAAAGLPRLVIGGFAVIAHGVARTTRDLDATVPGENLDVDHLLHGLSAVGIVARIDAPAEFAGRTQMLLMQHRPSGVLIDLSLAWLPFELDAIKAGVRTEVGGGVEVPIARAEDLVVYKTVAWRPVDQRDIAELLLLRLDEIDVARVRHVIELLAEALDDAERLEGFEESLRRAKRARGPT